MFWTNLIKGVCKIFLVLLIIGSVIGGIASGDFLIGILIIVGGIVVSFLLVSGMMMMCEISENVYEIRLNSRSSSNHSSLIKSYSNAPDSFVPESTQGSWKCPKCGKSNSNSSRVCKDCGYQK